MVEQIEIQTPGGTAEAYLARPETAPKGGVLVYMDTSAYQEVGATRHFADLEALYARTMV